MKVNKLGVLLFALISFFVYSAKAQGDMNKNWDRHYDSVTKYVQEGIPETALNYFNKNIKGKISSSDDPQYIKAQVYEMLLLSYQSETNNDLIKGAEAEITKAKSPVSKAIWQSIAADFYYKYFQGNQYEIYQRTAVATGQSENIDEWTAADFLKKIDALFKASLMPKQALLSIPFGQFQAILTTPINTEKLRPNLYDILAQKAKMFYKYNDLQRVKPINEFNINDERFFGDAKTFMQIDLSKLTTDTNSNLYQTLSLYQSLLELHSNLDNVAALLDVDLERLDFVHNKTQLNNKDLLYYQALQKVATQYSNNEGGKRAQVECLGLLINASPATLAMYPEQLSKRDIEKRLKKMVDENPNSETAQLASNLLVGLTQASISVQLENVLLPNENNRIFVEYKNVDEVYFTLYKLSIASLFENNNYNDMESFVRSKSIVKKWKVNLPKGMDLEQHSTELLLDPLDFGAYLIVVDNKEKSDSLKYVLGYNIFQVSNLTTTNVVDTNGAQMIILNRKNGSNIADATVKFYEWKWNNQSRKNERKLSKSERSNKNGIIAAGFKENNYQTYTTLVVKGNDTLMSDFYNYNYYNNRNNNNYSNSILLTDRSIYRPGQVVYFKGIVYDVKNNGKSQNVVAGRKVTVNFKDANYQIVKFIELETNEFGSYNGQFEIPEGIINGYFTIEDGIGSTSVSVEEYKRPKFFIAFDKLSGTYKLNDKVKIKGKATAFAGNSISEAAVTYRVVREVRFPYYWHHYSRPFGASVSKEIINGATTTSLDGSFEVPFEMQPDLSVDPQSNPIFTYTVYADVTDINGETHTINTQLSASYQSFVINALVPEDISKSQLKTIAVSTVNLNGEKVDEALDIALYKLDFPGIFRKRFWNQPTTSSFTKEEFRKLFPNDEFESESDPLNWSTKNKIQNWQQVLVNKNPIEINPNNFKDNGYYLMEIIGKSEDGKEIKDKKIFHLFDAALKNNPEKPLMVNAEKSSLEPGEPLAINIGSAFGMEAQILTLESTSDFDILHTDNRRKITKKIAESDRGGLNYSQYLVYNNRAYQNTQSIYVPWSNKNLKITWATHRDKLQPGASDEWTMNITGDKKEKVVAELLSVLYDASLDELKSHTFGMYTGLYPNHYSYNNWDSRNNFGISNYNYRNGLTNKYSVSYFQKSYADLFTTGDYLFNDFNDLNIGVVIPRLSDVIVTGYRNVAKESFVGSASRELDEMAAYREESSTERKKSMARNKNEDAAGDQISNANGFVNFAPPVVKKNAESNNDVNENISDVKVRSNFNETAYFLPQLITNENGDVIVKFTLPESLTKWKMMSYAHTKDMKTGFIEGSILAQKDLMVQPNMPRFFRQNDKIVLSTKIANLTKETLNGKVQLEILDPNTLQSLDLPFKHTEKTKSVQISGEGATEVSWELDIPQARYEPVLVRIKAQAGNFTDGEEHFIPVLTNRTLVTETKPLPIRGSGTFDFSMDRLKSNTSNTLLHKSFTIEYTANPAWYAVQALPYLLDYPHECAEQTFSKLYATAISRNIIQRTPNIEKIFEQWRTDDTAALLSNLEKNQELKSALLQETPWVMEAKNESQQKQLIGKLFERRNIEKQFNRWMNRMEQLQNEDGSWSWFPGMYANDFITQYIVTGLGKLNKVNALQLKSEDKANKMATAGLDYLDRSLVKEFEDLKRYNKEWKKLDNVSPIMVNYFYMRSFYKNQKLDAKTKEAYDFYYAIAKKKAALMSPYQKAQMALVTFRNDEKTNANALIQSLKETSMNNEELGMYWKNMPNGYYWYEANVEAQALIIEAFSEVTNDEQSVNDMKTWLLKQKQTQNWGTTKATADACYALIMKGENWLAANPEVQIQVGNKSIALNEKNTEAGTGYFKEVIAGKEVNNAMGDIKINVSQPAEAKNRASWGAAYWQYFEDMDKITAQTSPLSVSKKLFIKRNTNAGPQLFEVNNDDKLKVGDRLTVRVTIRVDRDMEYIHLKDQRAAAFEPVDVLSGYNYSSGLGYYRSISDASMNFFFDRINKGTYVFEYDMFVNAKGTYSNGISTIQCMYAPEFGAHTEGLRLVVE